MNTLQMSETESIYDLLMDLGERYQARTAESHGSRGQLRHE